ncbi:hypothetical protein VSH64_17030 [Amycolatopsis rhabdoformis]|uniref:LppX_LprAFG lipoprotein n=1 Tax=Amycolatopsis rhabdoformis TaxID=1448059 RepID=A0ABZ1II25_9PSEU|nr:hypothetical protein [Amycolatopsis rhabdoformis]WSE33789.1 hypothetical protein VSH64_17030 [Amycolatopsis rhabdoformis]
MNTTEVDHLPQSSRNDAFSHFGVYPALRMFCAASVFAREPVNPNRDRIRVTVGSPRRYAGEPRKSREICMRRTTVVVATGAALTLVLTGCGAKGQNGASSTSGDKPELGLAAPFQNALELSAASKQSAQKSKTAKVSMTAQAAGQTITAHGDYLFQPGNVELSLIETVQGQQAEVRIVDQTLYVKMPPAEASQLGADKPWFKITPGANDPLSQALSGSVGSASQSSDPTALLDRVAQAGRIVSSDQTTLDGEQVNHYQVELDLDKVLDKLTAFLPAATKATLEQQVKGKHITLPAEIWVDKNQLPRQITMDESPLTQAEGKGATGLGKTTLDYTDWGAPVTITAPPADQIGDLSQIVKKLGG